MSYKTIKKKLRTVLFILVFVVTQLQSLLLAQNNTSSDTNLINSGSSDFYLSFSSGFDNYTGILGIGGLLSINEKIFIRGGAGIGSWGGKLSLGIKFQDFSRSGLGFGIGYSYCTGLDDLDLDLPDDNDDITTVNMNLNPAGSINFTLNKNWVFKGGNVFYLETGYAIATGGNPDFEINDGSTLSSSAEWVMDIVRPGGLIAAAGFLLAF